MEKISETSYSKDFRVLINGEERSVYNTPVGDFTLASSKGRVEFEIEVAFEFDRVCVRPIKHELVPQREGQKLKFRYEMPIDRPLHLSIEFDDNLERPLFLLVSPSESGVPEPGDGFHFFGPGLHDIGVLELKSHNTVYLAEGAVVRSALHADSAENSRICGRGILDAENFHHGEVSGHVHMIFLKNCSYVEVEGITVMNNKGWTVLQSGCRNNTICDVKVITWSPNGDGFDIVSSKDIQLFDCFAKCSDDCVVVKAGPRSEGLVDADVENVLVQGGTFWNMNPGNAFKIGFETRCDKIDNIRFLDIDVIHVQPETWQSGAVFSIHNGDRATISNVVLEDIRVEQAECKLFDLKITLSRYSKDPDRGHIKGVLLKNISVVDGPLPPSIFQGFLRPNLVQDVTIENLTHLGRPITNPLDMHLILERSKDIDFI